MTRIQNDHRSLRDAPARTTAKAPATETPAQATGLTPAEIRKIVLDILG